MISDTDNKTRAKAREYEQKAIAADDEKEEAAFQYLSSKFKGDEDVVVDEEVEVDDEPVGRGQNSKATNPSASVDEEVEAEM